MERSITHSMTRHIPSLDGIRAISFLLVFVAHVGADKYVPGGFGVTIFFFLSGFLITTLMREEFEQTGRVNLQHFWLRRALRILPPFYIVLLGAAVISPLAVSGESLAAQAFHISNYWIIFHGDAGIPVGTAVCWSLAIEEHFYLLFPWAFITMQRYSGRVQALLMYGLCLAVLGWRIWLVGSHVITNRIYMASDARIDSILFGCALAVWCNPVLQPIKLNARRWKYLWCPSSFGLLAICIIVRDEEFRQTLRYSLQGIALTGVFIAAIRYPEWPIFKVLNSRFLKFIGLLSYSLYLLHLVVIGNVVHAFPNMDAVTRAIVALIISVALSWLMYIAVERPCARLRKRLSASYGSDRIRSAECA